MGKPYSSDLRDRVQRHAGAGHTRRNATIRFGDSARFAVKLDQRIRATGSTAPTRQGRPAGSGALAAFRDYLVELRGAVRAALVQLLEGGIGVSLEDCAASGQMLSGMSALPAGQEGIDRTRWRLPGPWPLIADIDRMRPCLTPLPSPQSLRDRSSTRIGVSPAGKRSLAMMPASIGSIGGASVFIAPPHQSARVVSGISAPMRAKISFCL